MREMNMRNRISKTEWLLAPIALAILLTATTFAATPGITGPTFNLTAQTAYLNQPDGQMVYSWGYGCNGAPAGFAPAGLAGANCQSMQVPGPTLIVTEGQTVTVTLTNNLPTAVGNTSILFPGFQVTSNCSASNTGVGAPQIGLLACEAVPGGSVTYTFSASSPGTRSYYSGTQSDLQIEMGLYGAVIVLPKNVPAACTGGLHAANLAAEAHWGERDFRLAAAAYDHPKTCYDREYLFQWAEMDPNIHKQAEAQVLARIGCVAGAPGCSLNVPTEPYKPAYFLINGRSMPDLMDPNYAAEYPHQPYNGNPHMHPGELTLIRSIGQGRWQHPFHEHANHVRILARDGNLILARGDGSNLAGILMFNTDTTPGQAFDGIFYFTGRGLNWDPYGHHPGDTSDPLATLPCTPDANGYNTGSPTAVNFWEWCQDHNKPLEVTPLGDVAGGGPATLPFPDILTNGAWYGGSPYLGPDATLRAIAPACATTSTSSLTCASQLPANTQANPANERGFAFMWHSHNEREITTNNVFPGGMLMMMLVDSREFVIDESN
jgi:FtsP/CotA-like multicopper oxidase with cupredoxin domain